MSRERAKGQRGSLFSKLGVLLGLSVIALGLAAPEVQAQTTWYVDDNAPNDPGPGDPSVSDPFEDGSPEHPFDAIQEGIDAATNADTVLVLDGTYTGNGNRGLDFGGKAITASSQNGSETCIIDCENAGRGFHFHNGETGAAVLDGLAIQNGCVASHGGGVYCNGSSPTIRNCTIRDNSVTGASGFIDGGGVCCANSSSPTITNCTISGNSVTNVGSASPAGGGLYCGSSCDATITICTITSNSTNLDGGGICCEASSPTITDCDIAYNSVPTNGAGVCCYGASPTISDCTIRDNSAGSQGGAIRCYSGSPTISNCTLSDNSAGTQGGAVYATGSCSPMITDSTISSNTAYAVGGGIACLGGSATVSRCSIIANSGSNGGGVYCDGGTPMIVNCSIAGNSGSGGGGVNCSGGTPRIVNCSICGNSATGNGGGMKCYGVDSGASVNNCVIALNSATGAASEGGAIFCDGCNNLKISNCTMTGNAAVYEAQAIDCEDAHPTVTNCIVWGNGDGTDQIRHVGAPTVTYCDVQGGFSGTGNINADPLFLDPDGLDDDPETWEDNDYRLSPSSPCIDAADNDSVAPDNADLDDDSDDSEPTPLDFDCRDRFVDYPLTADTGDGMPPIVDMGAYEYQACPGDVNGDDVVDIADLAALLGSYGACVGDPGYNYYADFNQDGCVDIGDLATLLGNYGGSCDNSCW
jgi:predicted outer membrane repeat protein